MFIKQSLSRQCEIQIIYSSGGYVRSFGTGDVIIWDEKLISNCK